MRRTQLEERREADEEARERLVEARVRGARLLRALPVAARLAEERREERAEERVDRLQLLHAAHA